MIDLFNHYTFSRWTKFSVAGVIIGALLKILHLPYANLAILVSFFAIVVTHLIHFLGIVPKRILDYSMLLLVISFSLFQVLRIMHWPYAETLFYVLGVCVIFYLIAYLFSDIKQKKRNLPLTIINTIGSIGVLVGATFKILHWPNANAILIVSMLTISLGFVYQSFQKQN